jgi:hypothetical protein
MSTRFQIEMLKDRQWIILPHDVDLTQDAAVTEARKCARELGLQTRVIKLVGKTVFQTHKPALIRENAA